MRCCVFGSRTITDYESVVAAIKLSGFRITELVSGRASRTKVYNLDKGRWEWVDNVDRLAERWAHSQGIPVTTKEADWTRYGKSAGYRRNAEMVEYLMETPDDSAAIGIWDGRSPGSKMMLDLCTRRGIPVSVTIVEVEPGEVPV